MKATSPKYRPLWALLSIVSWFALCGCGKQLGLSREGDFKSPPPPVLTSCADALKGTLIKHSPSADEFEEGTLVLWEIKAEGGCTTRYRVILSNEQTLDLSYRTFFHTSYTPGEYEEKVHLLALDSKGSIQDEIRVVSKRFVVTEIPPIPRLECEVTPSAQNGSAYYDGSGNLVGNKPFFTFAISCSKQDNPVNTQVTDIQIQTSGDFPGVTTPTNSAATHSLEYVPNTTGRHAIIFEITETDDPTFTKEVSEYVDVIAVPIQPTVTIDAKDGAGSYTQDTLSVSYAENNVTLRWQSTYADSCTVTRVNADLSTETMPWTEANRVINLGTDLTEDVRYNITCTGIENTNQSDTILIDVAAAPPAVSCQVTVVQADWDKIRLRIEQTGGPAVKAVVKMGGVVRETILPVDPATTLNSTEFHERIPVESEIETHKYVDVIVDPLYPGQGSSYTCSVEDVEGARKRVKIPNPEQEITVPANNVSASHQAATGPAIATFGHVAGKYWNAGDYPVEWIQGTFSAPTTVFRIRLKIAQLPDGYTQHHITDSSTRALIRAFVGNTVEHQILDTGPLNTTINGIRVTTYVSPSWVSWLFIKLYRCTTTRACPATFR